MEPSRGAGWVKIGNRTKVSRSGLLSALKLMAEGAAAKRKAAFLEPELRPVSGLQKCASHSMALGTR